MGPLSPWQLLILVAVLVLLFGAKKLPDAARGVGRSLKILKAETKDLRDEDGQASDPDGQASAAESQASNADTKALPSAAPPAAAPAESGEKTADLQRQLDELKQQKNAG